MHKTITAITVKTLRIMCSDDQSSLFSVEVESLVSAKQVQQPEFSRMKISLEKLEVDSTPREVPNTPDM